MLIRYHLIYYAVGCLLATCGRYLHPVFWFIFLGYLYWLYRRLLSKHLIFMILLALCTCFCPHDMSYEFSTYVEGTVVKATDTYCYLKTSQGTLKLYHDEDISYHDTLKCQIVQLEMNHQRNDHAFDEKNYLYSVGVVGKGKIVSILWQEHHYGLYHWLADHLIGNSQTQDYQRLFLLGERSQAIEEDYELLSNMSLVHLFALSGMHVHILMACLEGIIGLFLTQKYTRFLSYLFLGIYIFSIPMSISLYRAFFILVLSDLLKKWFHSLDVFSLLVIISLLYNPYLIFHTAFVLSYFVYLIVLLTKGIKHQYLLIYLSTIPMIMFLNSQISILSFVLGLCLLPFIEWFYRLCLACLLFPFLQYGLDIAVQCLQVILAFLNDLDQFLTFSTPSLSFILVYYIIFFALLYAMQMHHSIRLYICAFVALMLVFFVYGKYKIYGEITMIDVGQGDCTLIRLPMNQGNILIDTGGMSDYDLAQQTLIPYFHSIGVDHLDYVYISHDDFDHCGALASLQEHFLIDHVIRQYEAFRQIGDVQVRMLSYLPSSSSNDQSLIMKVDFKDFHILFMGDASKQVEQQLYQKYKHLEVDILKVSHHGSQSATSPILFQMIQPQVAMIGVKKSNMYHHPSSAVISRLKRKGIKILRTDEDGMFHIRYYDQGYFVFK